MNDSFWIQSGPILWTINDFAYFADIRSEEYFITPIDATYVMILDDYEPIGDEDVRKVPVLLQRHWEIHRDQYSFIFNKIDYKMKKVPGKETRTVDYENEDLGIEVTSIPTHDVPRI